MKSFVVAAAVLAFGTTIAFAQDSTEQPAAAPAPEASAQPAEQPAPEAEDPRLQEVVCRTTRITGSLTRRQRTCMTRAEWNDFEARTQEELRRQGRQASGGYQCRQDQMGGC